MAVPERPEYLGALDSLAQGDCATAAPRLGTLAAGPKSPLSDNVLYWQARCAAARGDLKGAESELEDLVTRYPRGDKAPAALLERGKLLIRSGDPSSARTTFSRLIKEYPTTAEAAQARLKITELER
jgi:TolA-binding protein